MFNHYEIVPVTVIWKSFWLVMVSIWGLSACSKTDQQSTVVCSAESRAASMPAVRLPYPQGASYKVSQAYNGSFSHAQAPNNYALDFTMPEGSNLVAVASGRVMHVKEDTPSNDNCQNFSCAYKANVVQIDFGGGIYGLYNHLCNNCVHVAVGDTVTAGQVIAQSGNTGFSTEPHLHFQIVSFNSGCSISYAFDDVSGNGLAQAGQTYTSNNNGSHGVTYTASSITGSAFSSNGVSLTTSIPWSISQGTTLTIRGKVTIGATEVAVFIMPAEGGTALELRTGRVNNDGTFDFTFTPTLQAGSYSIALDASAIGTFSTNHIFPFLIE